MECDMVVALGKATVRNNSLVGFNTHFASSALPQLKLCRLAGSLHSPDEAIQLGDLRLPPARQTHTVLGLQPAGVWGLTHGLNEHGVAAGMCRWKSRLPRSATGLLGTDLVRLTLQRSNSARQAVDLLTDLLARHGQRGNGSHVEPGDHIFLVADGRESFVVEAAGPYWAMLECHEVRAVSDVGLIRQDWRRLAPGMAEFAIAQAWWPDDGSKLDVAGSLGVEAGQQSWPMKRWGKATMLLEQQNGHLDHHVLRRLLAEHFETIGAATPPRNVTSSTPRLLASAIFDVPSEKGALPVFWCGVGPESAPLYLPLFPLGELPPPAEGSLLSRTVENEDALGKLQARIDQEAEEFLRSSTSPTKERVEALMHSHREILSEGAEASMYSSN